MDFKQLIAISSTAPAVQCFNDLVEVLDQAKILVQDLCSNARAGQTSFRKCFYGEYEQKRIPTFLKACKLLEIPAPEIQDASFESGEKYKTITFAW